MLRKAEGRRQKATFLVKEFQLPISRGLNQGEDGYRYAAASSTSFPFPPFPLFPAKEYGHPFAK